MKKYKHSKQHCFSTFSQVIYKHVVETLGRGSQLTVSEQNLCHSSWTVQSPPDSAGNSKDSPQLKQTSRLLDATEEFCLSAFLQATKHTTFTAWRILFLCCEFCCSWPCKFDISSTIKFDYLKRMCKSKAALYLEPSQFIF